LVGRSLAVNCLCTDNSTNTYDCRLYGEPLTMTVEELIKELTKITDKSKQVFVYCEYDMCEGDLLKINFIDDDLSNRVDINVG
jgi:hypothetical protein